MYGRQCGPQLARFPGMDAGGRRDHSAARTSSSCVFGDTFSMTLVTTPSTPITNVERWARWVGPFPRPYIDFSIHTPYASHTEWSSSARSVKFSSWPSWNFLTAFTESGETPRTVTPASL